MFAIVDARSNNHVGTSSGHGNYPNQNKANQVLKVIYRQFAGMKGSDENWFVLATVLPFSWQERSQKLRTWFNLIMEHIDELSELASTEQVCKLSGRA